MALLMPQGKHQYFTTAGEPLVGGKVYTYAAGTSTLLTTYSAQSGAPGTENTNPVVLDARGEATIFFGAAGYKVVLRDALDNIIWTQDNLFPNSVLETFTITDDLTFTGTGGRITGDFNNATHANRVLFQNSVTNGGTNVGFIPNGTGVSAVLNLYGASDPANCGVLQFAINSTETYVSSSKFGTGAYFPLNSYVSGIKNTTQPITGGFQVVQPALLGYGTGAGGTVTQTGSKNTAVELNTPCGKITTHNENVLAGTTVQFVFFNSKITANSVLVLSFGNTFGASSGSYNVWCSINNGSAQISLRNISGGTLGDAVPLNFVVLEGATT
jgi:hypothetical protein